MENTLATTTIRKSEPTEMLDALPDPVEVEGLMYRLYLHEKWAAGEAAIAGGRVLSTDDVRARVAGCRK